MKLSRQGRPWKGEVPRNWGPGDPVENRQRIAREKGEDRAIGREALEVGRMLSSMSRRKSNK